MVNEQGFIPIDFQKLGLSIVSVKAGTPIHILARVQMSEGMRFNYGYDGYNPEKIEG